MYQFHSFLFLTGLGSALNVKWGILAASLIAVHGDDAFEFDLTGLLQVGTPHVDFSRSGQDVQQSASKDSSAGKLADVLPKVNTTQTHGATTLRRIRGTTMKSNRSMVSNHTVADSAIDTQFNFGMQNRFALGGLNISSLLRWCLMIEILLLMVLLIGLSYACYSLHTCRSRYALVDGKLMMVRGVAHEKYIEHVPFGEG